MSLPDPSTHDLETPPKQANIQSSKGFEISHALNQDLQQDDHQLESENILRVEAERGQDQEQNLIDLDEEAQPTRQVASEKKRSSGENGIEELEGKTDLLSLSRRPALNHVDDGAQNSGSVNSRDDDPDGASRDEAYMDPTPKTPRQETSPQRQADGTTEAQGNEGSTSEIQSIMDQFEDEDDPGEDVKRAESGRATSLLTSPVQHPPRRSSLEPLKPPGPEVYPRFSNKDDLSTDTINTSESGNTNHSSEMDDKHFPARISSLPQSAHYRGDAKAPSSPTSSRSLSKVPPPAPDPEPDLPFDFHRFLEQLRHRTADPVAKFLRSFLIEFGKKQWMVHEQVKIISDFLTFIANKMAQCEIWRGVSDAEFDNAKEGMEKLVMNRLYSQTFSPAIPPPTLAQGTKGKKKNIEKLLGPGRKGQHQEDIERDEILGQKVRIYGWIQEEHLDISPVSDSGRRFLVLAQQELLKIKTYRAPRDKVICVLNCCKVIFGLLRNSKSADTSADSFVPLLIYVVLHANPDHLVSNVQYILRFRNQDKLGGEAGYYLSSLMGAIQFVENLDRTSLTISDEDFEKRVEEAVSIIAERHRDEMPMQPPPRHAVSPQISEKSTLSQPEVIARNSIDAEYSTPPRLSSSRVNQGSSTGNGGPDDGTAVSGLLKTIQRPLSSLGRMFSEDTPNIQQKPPEGLCYQPNQTGRLSPAVFQPPPHNEERHSGEESRSTAHRDQNPDTKISAEDAAARQASTEAAEAQRIQRAEHRNVVETLAGMFPNLDKDIIDDVVRVKHGRVGLAVDACLALNS